MPAVIKEVTDAADFAICMAIRMEVFVREQNVPLDEEMDEFDATATHYLARVDGQPAATARTRVIDGTGKIERVAVRAPQRGTGVGRELMEHLIARLRNHPQVKQLKLSSQTQALPFYEKLGFEVTGEEYMEAGIPHRMMQRAL